MTPNYPLYSVVIPFKDEEDNIDPLLKEVICTMDSLEKTWELIVVDDGSQDNTWDILDCWKKKHNAIRPLRLDKNYGQSSAFMAGFDHAKGSWIITLDGDGQNDPQDIPKLLFFKDSFSLIVGKRAKRQDSLSKKIISKWANAIRQKVCQDGVNDTGCSLKVYERNALLTLPRFKGMHRFFPALFVMNDLRVKEVEVSHRERKAGKSHYHFWNRSFNTVFDLLAMIWLKKRTLKYKVKEPV